MATLVVQGNEADNRLYIPTITRTRQVMGQGGRLYIGDAKMGALATRAFVQDGGDYYLMPLALTGEVPELLTTLLEPVWNGEQQLERIYPPASEESGCGKVETKKTPLALGYEVTRWQEAQANGQPVRWEERLLVVYSPSLAKRA